ncbi:MAG TPA: aminotransferase class I/II-fold pyridoxal phosphate-dependent enzyme [Candidatus Avilachnospira avistercoris]|nr:aminotransferase class I/II-fold pyridoxal phosphate-dependent enzyme [Candidatus Avilachnospira avistercoris]
MRDALNSFIASMPSSGIRKFFDIVTEMNDPEVISLGVGEPDFDTPWHVREEGIYSLTKGKTFYSPNAGLKELREGIARFLNRRYGLSYDPKDEIIVTVGGSEAIDLCFRAMLDPGDEVIVPEPAFVSYKPCVRLAGGVPVVIDLKNEDDFKLKPEALEAAISDKTKILFLSYPNNPTGAIMTREDLLPIAKIVKKYDLFVVSDEIYSELNYSDGPHVSIASLPGMRERTVVINGFSKAYAMTGWRLGYAAAPAYIAAQLLKIHQYAIMCAPTTAQYAAVEAINNGEQDTAMMREEYNERRRYLLKRFRDMDIDCFEALGAFYVFPDISAFGLSSEEFATRLLHEQKLAVVPGSAFGASGEGHLRISYAYSLKDLKRAVDRIEAFIKCLT